MHRLRGHEATARQCGRARRQGPGAVQRGAHTENGRVMAGDLRILEGATFCICDELGDLHGKVEGLFAEDTRFLSSLKLTINGERPLLLSSDKIEYFSAAFFMRNPLARGLAQDSLSIRRERFVGDGMQDSFVVQNQSMERVEFDLSLEVAADFADIFAVKDYDFALEPRERWDLHVEVIPLPDGELVAPRFAELRFGEEVGRVRDSLAAWQLRVPQLRASWDALGYSFGQSVSDLASLRMRSDNTGIGKLPGAGVPWFMTVFGRDTIITCLQTLLFGPELARTATGTATVSSNTSGARSRVWTTNRGRTRGIPSASTTGASRARRSRPVRCRDTSTTQSGVSPTWRVRSGETGSWLRVSTARPTSCANGSTRRSGSRNAGAITRLRSMRRSEESTRSAPTSAICSGAASSRRIASTPSSTS